MIRLNSYSVVLISIFFIQTILVKIKPVQECITNRFGRNFARQGEQLTGLPVYNFPHETKLADYLSIEMVELFNLLFSTELYKRPALCSIAVPVIRACDRH
jgi:hypothetical protein